MTSDERPRLVGRFQRGCLQAGRSNPARDYATARLSKPTVELLLADLTITNMRTHRLIATGYGCLRVAEEEAG